MDKDAIFLNLDWDPCYLASIFDMDFNDMSVLWNCEGVSDSVIMNLPETSGIYCPLVEDISLDDNDLHDAVEKIESE